MEYPLIMAHPVYIYDPKRVTGTLKWGMEGWFLCIEHVPVIRASFSIITTTVAYVRIINNLMRTVRNYPLNIKPYKFQII